MKENRTQKNKKMKITHMSDQEILDYIFTGLPKKQEEEIEKFLLKNEGYSEYIDTLLDMCLENRWGRKELEDYLNTIDFSKWLSEWKEKQKKPGSSQRKKKRPDQQEPNL